MRQLCEGTKTAWKALGKVDYGRKSSEQGNVKFRRSLYFVKPLQKGSIITEESIRSVRPGFGLAPKYMENVIGKIVSRDIEPNTPVTEEAILGFVK